MANVNICILIAGREGSIKTCLFKYYFWKCLLYSSRKFPNISYFMYGKHMHFYFYNV